MVVDFNPRIYPPGHIDYGSYLKSAEWFHKRTLVLIRAEWICEVRWCLNLAQDVHHLTYDRLGNEKLEDLKAVCRWHHTLIHGRKF